MAQLTRRRMMAAAGAGGISLLAASAGASGAAPAASAGMARCYVGPHRDRLLLRVSPWQGCTGST